MKKVLFISEQIPFRQNAGHRVRIFNLLRCLEDATHLHCVSLEPSKPQRGELLIRCQLHHVRLDGSHKLSTFAHLWRRMIPLLAERDAIEKLIDHVQPDLIWLEFGFLGHLVPLAKRKKVPVVVSTHNVESYLYQVEWLKSFSLVQKVLRLPYLALNRLHEWFFFRLADKVVSISQKDQEYYERFIPKERLSVIPNFRINDFAAVSKFTSVCRYVCIVGSLGAFQNYQGVVFFVRSVWPLLKQRYPDLQLYLVGAPPSPGTQKFLGLQDLTKGQPDVIMTGEVDSTIPYVKGAVASVVPIFDGSGTRTKVIESVACGVPVVSTRIGAEGLPFENGHNILIADSPQEFVNSLAALLDDSELGTRIATSAYALYEKEFGYDANKSRLELLLNSIKRVTNT